MKYARFVFRAIASCLHVLFAAAVCPLLGRPQPAGFTPRQSGVISWLIRVQLRLLGVRVHVRGEPGAQAPLLVSNHISWLDILVIGSLRTSCFLSKAEVRKWFLIGGIAPHFGTLFINRGGGSDEARQAIALRLQHNTSTVIFPEGTTSDGSTVGRMHPRLFAAAIDTQTAVQPVALRYPAGGGGLSPLVPFVRDQNLFDHALRLLHQQRIDVHVSFTRTVASAGMERRELADKCRELIAAELDD